MSEHEESNLISQVFGTSDTDIPSTTGAKPSLEPGDEIFALSDDFDFDEFQVVRREFFAHLHEPSFTFNNCKIYVNAACIAKFPSTDYVQVLVNQEKKILALRPCSPGDRDSFLWCNDTGGKRKARQVTAKLFFAKIFTLMGWNPEHRYKLLGQIVYSKGMYLVAFDLTSTEVYQRSEVEGAKSKTSRTPVFPAHWQNQFGLPFNEHQQSMQINIFDGYAIYAIKEPSRKINKPDTQVREAETSGTLSEDINISCSPNDGGEQNG